MSVSFERIGRTCAARTHGADLARGIGPAEVEAIEAGLARNGVPGFENQHVDDDAQQAFIRQFGPPHQAVLKEIASNPPHFCDIGTVDIEGNPGEKDGTAELYMRANLLWHTTVRRTSRRSG